MRSKSLLVIVLIGFGGLAALAAVTKLAFDNDGRLRNITAFQRHLIEVFSARGVEKVTFRCSSRRRGTELRLDVGSAEVRESDPMHREMAEMVLGSFPQSRGALKLEYFRRAGFGCQRETPFLVRELRFAEIRHRLLERRRRRATGAAVGGQHEDIEILSVAREKRVVRVSVRSTAKGNRSREKIETVLDDVATAVHRFYPVPRSGSLHVKMVTAAGETERELAEAGYDAGGKRRRLEFASGAPPAGRGGRGFEPAKSEDSPPR